MFPLKKLACKGLICMFPCLQFDQQGLGMDRSYYSQNDSHLMVTVYRKFMRDIARLFNATEADITEFVDIVFDFERQLAEVRGTIFCPSRILSRKKYLWVVDNMWTWAPETCI